MPERSKQKAKRRELRKRLYDQIEAEWLEWNHRWDGMHVSTGRYFGRKDKK